MARRVSSDARAAALGAALLASIAHGCGDEFDPISLVDRVRVFAVRGEPAFARPGGEVELTMLWHDGSPDARLADGSARPIQIAWFGGCHNPPGDVFYGCMPMLAERFASIESGAAPEPGTVGSGDSFTATFPEDVISSRPPPAPGLVPYGRSFVFFAVCAGRIVPTAPSDDAGQIPLACLDEAGNARGPEDFVVGYFPVFSYGELDNDNPLLSGLSVGGRAASHEPCDPPSAATGCDAGERCGSQGKCIPVLPRCTAAVQDDCPEIPLAPVIDPSSAEADPAAITADGEVPTESIWVSYYASAGKIDRESAVVSDSVDGWTGDFDSVLLAPLEGNREMRLWVVAHDNRGGGSWVVQDVWIE